MPYESNYVNEIIHAVRKNSAELPYIEFKVNDYRAQDIGEYINNIKALKLMF